MEWSNSMDEKKIMTETVVEYERLLESLRSRLNVLNTSVFLLEDNLSISDLKTSEYILKINNELERIRKLITDVPGFIQVRRRLDG